MPPNCLAGLDTVVQIAAGRPILSASVAFVALSGEAEYAYACVFASAVTRRFAPPESLRLLTGLMALVRALKGESSARSPVRGRAGEQRNSRAVKTCACSEEL